MGKNLPPGRGSALGRRCARFRQSRVCCLREIRQQRDVKSASRVTKGSRRRRAEGCSASPGPSELAVEGPRRGSFSICPEDIFRRIESIGSDHNRVPSNSRCIFSNLFVLYAGFYKQELFCATTERARSLEA